MRYTKQTPDAVRQWLLASQPEFPGSWTLHEVSEESRRRYLANRWPSEVAALRAIAHWAAHKLALTREFSASSWGWIAGGGPFGPQDHYARLATILEPAIAQGPAWRTTASDRTTLLREIEAKTLDLLQILETERRLDVDFRDVVGLRPEMQPLVDLEFEIQQVRMRQVRQGISERRVGKVVALPPAEHPGFVSGPRLSDYLCALRAKIAGQSERAYPRSYGDLPDELLEPDDDQESCDFPDEWEADNARLIELMGGDPGGVDGPYNPALLRAGGDFGGYPNQTVALRSAVIRAFPRAIFDRMEDAPEATPAGVIEAACIAWFGNSPTQKEINALIKPDRSRLEAAMNRTISATKADAALRLKWKEEGLSEEEIQKRQLQSFLSGE